MAPLTWRNVEAPNFSGVTSSLGVAAQLLSNATGGLSDAIDKRRTTQRQQASSAAMLDALKYTDAESFGEALRTGRIGGGDPSKLNAEAINLFAGRQRDLLGNDTVRLNNSGLGIANEASQFNLDQGKITAKQRADYLANTPAANKAFIEARTLFDSGDPAQRARGRQMIADNANLFSSAGMSVDDVLSRMGGNDASFNQGLRTNEAIAANQDFYKERYRQQGQEGLINSLVSGPNRAIDAQDALAKARSLGLDTTTLSNVTKQITDNAETYFPAPTSRDMLNIRAGGQAPATKTSTPADIMANYAVATPRAEKNAQQSGVPYIGYDNQNAKRNKPLSQNLVQATSFLPEMGIEMRVFSGGQNSQAEGTGSPRHNHGDAADVFFYRNGKKLDWSNPADQPIFQEIVRRGRENGLTGFGAGDGYMQRGSMHIGFGKEGIWGAGGKGENAAPWLREAFGSAKQGATPSTMMRDTVVRGGGQPTGSTITQPTTATNMLNNAAAPQAQPVVVQTNNGPVQVAVTPPTGTPEVAPTTQTKEEQLNALPKRSISGGGTAYEDSNGNLFQKGDGGTYNQVDSTGMPIGTGNYQPVAIAPVAAAPAPKAAEAPKAALTAAQILEQARTANNSANVDRATNSLSGIDTYMQNPSMQNQLMGQVVQSLLGSKDAPGPAAGISQEELTAGMRKIKEQRPNMTWDMAGALAVDNLKTGLNEADVGRWFGPEGSEINPLRWGINPFSATPFFDGKKKEVQIDADRAASAFDNYVQNGSNQAGNIAGGVGRATQQQQQTEAQAIVQQSAAQLTELQGLQQRILVAVQQGVATPDMIAQLRAIEPQIQMLQVQLQAAQQKLSPYSRTQIGNQ